MTGNVTWTKTKPDRDQSMTSEMIGTGTGTGPGLGPKIFSGNVAEKNDKFAHEPSVLDITI